MKANIGWHTREFAFNVESTTAEIKSAPRLREPLKAIESVNEMLAYARRHKANGATRVYAEFQVVAINLRFGERVFDQFALGVKTEGVGHGALDIIDRSVKRAQ